MNRLLSIFKVGGRCGSNQPTAAEDQMMPQQVASSITRALAGEPVINTEPSRTGADQPNKEEQEQDFGKIEQIVEPAKRRKSFRQGGYRAGQGGDNHIDH